MGFFFLCNFMMFRNDRVHCKLMVVFVCLYITLPYYHHYADLYECVEHLKYLSGTLCLECVYKLKWILSIIFHAIYGAVRIRLTHFSDDDDYENMCSFIYLIIITSYVWPICHCLGLSDEIILCPVCLFTFFRLQFENDCPTIGLGKWSVFDDLLWEMGGRFNTR